MGCVQLSKTLRIHAAQGDRRASGQPCQMCRRFWPERPSARMGSGSKNWGHERQRGTRSLGRSRFPVIMRGHRTWQTARITNRIVNKLCAQ